MVGYTEFSQHLTKSVMEASGVQSTPLRGRRRQCRVKPEVIVEVNSITPISIRGECSCYIAQQVLRNVAPREVGSRYIGCDGKQPDWKEVHGAKA